MPDFEKLTEEVKEKLEEVLFNDFCSKNEGALWQYADYLSALFAEQARIHFAQNPEKHTYKVKIRFWGGFVNAAFSFFRFDEILERKFWDVWEDDSVKVKVKLEFDDGYCIIKCKFKVKSN